MAYAKGAISKIFIKAKDAPDQYGNTHRAAVKIDEVGDFWIGMGDLKGDKLTVQMGAKNWVELTEGSVVEFMYTEKPGNNGNVFRDAKRSGVKVLELASPGASSSRAPSPAPATAPKAPSASQSVSGRSTGGGTDWAKKDAGAAASASVDKAIALLSATGSLDGTGADVDRIRRTAREMQKIVLELADEILAGNQPKAVETEKPKPTPKPAPKPKPAARTEAQRDEELATQRTWEDEDTDSPFD